MYKLALFDTVVNICSSKLSFLIVLFYSSTNQNCCDLRAFLGVKFGVCKKITFLNSNKDKYIIQMRKEMRTELEAKHCLPLNSVQKLNTKCKIKHNLKCKLQMGKEKRNTQY